jgi:hypothetical protein
METRSFPFYDIVFYIILYIQPEKRPGRDADLSPPSIAEV